MPSERHLRLLALLLPLLLAACPTSAQDCDFEAPDDTCRATAGGLICSGRGVCVCGNCECHPGIRGRFCECDDRTCPRDNGQLCGGRDHGVCECGRCRCRPGWTGEACECSTSTDSCVEPGSSRVCSNKGVCECGRCRCAEYAGERYSGMYCDVCPTCVGKCDTYRHCVECLAFKTGPLKSRCREACGSVQMLLVDEISVDGPSDRMCSFFTPDDCRYTFVYGSGGALRVKRKRQCPQVAPGLVAPSTNRTGGSSGPLANAFGILLAALCAAAWW